MEFEWDENKNLENIKNPEVESLAAEVARRLGTSKTEAIKVALRRQLDESDQGVAPEVKLARMRKFLEERIWPHVDASAGGGSDSTPRKALLEFCRG